MSRRLPYLSLLFLALMPTAVFAQRGYAYRTETVEPPLADAPNAAEIIRQASGQSPRPPVPGAQGYDMPVAGVILRLQAPLTLQLNQDVDVRMVVENVSQVLARNVTVVYSLNGASTVKSNPPLPPGEPFPGCATWKFETLGAGARQEILLSVKPPAGTTDYESKARVMVDQEQSTKTHFAKAELKLTKTGPKQALRFDILVFAIAVDNPGNVELRDVTVTDRLPAGLVHRPDDDKDRPFTQGPQKMTSVISEDGQTRTWKIDRLAPKEIRRIEYHVNAATAPAGTIEHQAFAQAAGGAQDTATAKVELVEPKLELTAEAPARKSATVPATVKITLTNTGPRVLQNILVTDIHEPCKVESASNAGQKLPDRVQWIVPSLGPNQKQVFELTVSKSDGGTVRHKVSAVYRGLNRPAETATEFEAVAALAYEFRGTPTTIETNGEVVYELTLRNSGSAPATNIRPTIELPPEFTLVKAEPENKVEGGKVSFEPIASFPPNSRATFRVTAKAVKASLGARVTAELSGDPFPTGPVKRQEMTAIGAAPAAPPAPAPTDKGKLPVPVPPPPG
jgi:uncharacterized repeat protein (TIGR01451 family)